MNSFRFEMLEQRTCMASDLDATPLGLMTLSTPVYYEPINQSAIAHYAGINLQFGAQLDDEDCLIPPTFDAYALDIELCIDGFVGARRLSSASPAVTAGGDALTEGFQFRSAYSDLQDQPFLNNASNQNFFVVDAATIIRPNIVDVPQVIVDEGEGEDPPTITTMVKDPQSPAGVTSRTSKHGEVVEHQASTRKASFVAAIDWNHGSKPDSILASVVEDYNQSTTRESNTAASDSARPSVSSDHYSWTGLLAYKAPQCADSASNGSASNTGHESDAVDEVRPLIATLRGMDSMVRVISESTADAVHANSRFSDPANTASGVEQIPGSPNQHVPAKAVSETTVTSAIAVTEAGALPLAVFLPTDEEAAPQSPPASRMSRFWLLAAVPAYFALPRRVRDRLPALLSLNIR